MKKILSVLALAVMSCMLLASCVTMKPKSVEPTPVPMEKTYNIDFINRSENFAFAIMCVVPLPAEEGTRCIVKQFAIYPERLHKEHGEVAPSVVTIQLKSGDYGFIVVVLDLRTNKQIHTEGRFSVSAGDGEMIFKDLGMRAVGNVNV